VTRPVWHLIDSRNVGGAERHIAGAVGALRRRGIPAEAVLYRDYGNNVWLTQLRNEGIPHRVLGGSIRALMQAIARERPAILHTHGYKASVFGRLAAVRFRLPVVTTFHSGERSGGKLRLYELLDEWTSLPSARIAVTQTIQKRLPFRSVVIHNFVAIPATPLPANLPRRIAFIGRLSPEKRPALFCQLAEAHAGDLEWHVYGDGPLRDDLERRFKKVKFHGVVADMAKAWQSVGLLLMPSRFEGLPLAALESLAAGVPILASNVGGLPDAVIEDKTGWLFQPDDLHKARDALARWEAMDSKAQHRMRLECRAHAQSRFSEAEQIPKLLDVYRNVGYSVGANQ